MTQLITGQERQQFSSCYPIVAETRLLKPVAQTVVPVRTKPISLAEFFQPNQASGDILVYQTFVDRLDLRARRVNLAERSYVASFLKADACDRDIRRELPEKHLSTAEEIASLLAAQIGGQSNFLPADGWVALFYLEDKNGDDFAAGVYRRPVNRFWHVCGWGPKDKENDYWRAGTWILCPGTAVL